MIERDAEATKARLLAAATAEFAEHGIAGARIDRVAKAARANKAQIYHYFGSKEALFDAVFGGLAQASIASDYFDAGDLPETACRIFDQLEASPQVARLALWYRLERSGSPDAIDALAAANAAKIDKIAAAQAAGSVSSAFPPDVLLGLLITLASAWASLPPEFGDPLAAHDTAARRGFVQEAARRLVAPDVG